jgi:hypothetical protein
MKEWLRPARYHAVVLLFMMSLCSIGFAWLTYGLITVALANIGFLTEHGLMAVVEGGLLQFAQLSLQGFMALLCYLGFKGIEHELVYRWLAHNDARD